MSDPICVDCRSSLFSPTASICAFCEQYPHSKETEVGLLKRIWIYDKVDHPDLCVTCGRSKNLEGVEFSISADENPTSIGKAVLLYFIPIFGWILAIRAFCDAVKTTGDFIEVNLKQCTLCAATSKVDPIQYDLPNKRTEILAGEDFIRELELKK